MRSPGASDPVVVQDGMPVVAHDRRLLKSTVGARISGSWRPGVQHRRLQRTGKGAFLP